LYLHHGDAFSHYQRLAFPVGVLISNGLYSDKMTLSTTISFSEILPAEMHQPLLHYLNLPPVGCIADNQGIFDPDNEQMYELAGDDRQRILQERTRVGGTFTTIGDLEKLHAAHPRIIPAIVNRLADISRYGNRVQPVWGGRESRNAFFQLLQGAEKYIHIATYILGGTAGLEIIDLLKEKMHRGVEVRLLFCASGMVLSGSPSGTGFVSRLSGLRSFLVNDMYARKKLLKELQITGVPYRDSSPIGCHWRRLDMRQLGIKTELDYYNWAKQCTMPQEWLDEQRAIDRQSRIGFVNVDHRKMTIVDGDKAFIGSQNLSDSYFYDNALSDDAAVNKRKWQWHDGSCILEGGSVHQLSDLFAGRWWLSGGDRFDYTSSFYKPRAVRKGNACVTAIATIPGTVRVPLRKNLPGFLLTSIGARRNLHLEGFNPVREWLKILPRIAADNMIVQHCYPSDTELLHCWSHAARELRSFQMMVPKHYDVVFLGKECDSNFPSLIAAGAEVYAFRQAIMHSKLVVMDNFYSVTGSYNINVRSSRADMECTFFIQCRELGEGFTSRFNEDLKRCEQLNPGKIARFRSRFSIPIIDAILRYIFF
jgi:phosphatidylserine/phosphatidylglycerophosphate/cardiolipin synthase-like enzyme